MQSPNSWVKLLLAAGFSAAASLAQAQSADLSGSVGLAGSEHLRLRALGSGITSGSPTTAVNQRMRQELSYQGYYAKRGQIKAVARQVWLSPLLGWDGNINGGVLRDRIDFNGLTFEVDPDYRAKAGVVVGGSVGAMTRLAWDEGRVIDLVAQAELGWSPKHEVGRQDLFLQACSRNHLMGWSFLDLCAAGSRSFRELGDSTSHRLSADVAQVFALGPSLHELGFTLARADSQTEDQNRVGLSLDSLWRGSSTSVALSLGEAIPDATVMRERLDLGLKHPVLGRDIGLDLWGQRAEGSAFLGTPREDKVWGFGISTDLRPGLGLRLGYSDSTSTAAIADYEQVTLDLRFDRLRW